jgi:predicted transcriptional regulator
MTRLGIWPELAVGRPHSSDLDPQRGFPYAKAMEVHFAPELQAKLDRVAAENRRGADEYVQQLVENYLDHDAWFRQKVSASLDKLDGGESVSHEDVGARLQQIFQP